MRRSESQAGKLSGQFRRRSIIEALGGYPTEAEKKVLAACKTGEVADLGDDVPTEKTPENSVRGALIRYLLLGGCDKHQPHQTRVSILGAWIDDTLDLEGCETGLDLLFLNCHFAEELMCRDASMRGLFLNGSHLAKGANFQRLKTQNDITLRDGFHCTGLVDLCGAQIGGQLSCRSGRFDGTIAKGEIGIALDCEAAQIGKDVLLDSDLNGEDCHITGSIDFRRINITGNLIAKDVKIDGSLDLQSAVIHQGFIWQDVSGKIESVDLIEAHIGVLRDDVSELCPKVGDGLKRAAYHGGVRAPSFSKRKDMPPWPNLLFYPSNCHQNFHQIH